MNEKTIQPTKKIEDYLHLYLGCEAMVEQLNLQNKWVSANPTKLCGYDVVLSKEGVFAYKPILRPLSDMTEEEYDELALLNEDESVIEVKNDLFEFAFNPSTAATTKKLLEWGFDLFGLMEAGLALDKTTL